MLFLYTFALLNMHLHNCVKSFSYYFRFPLAKVENKEYTTNRS